MATNHTSRFETAARARKAAEIYAYARARRITALDVATDNGTRMMLVNVASVREPSDTTWRLIVGMLADAERIDAARTVSDVA